jgi:hypothetical protein
LDEGPPTFDAEVAREVSGRTGEMALHDLGKGVGGGTDGGFEVSVLGGRIGTV